MLNADVSDSKFRFFDEAVNGRIYNEIARRFSHAECHIVAAINSGTPLQGNVANP